MKRSFLPVLLLLVATCSVVHSYSVSQPFTQAINAAVAELVGTASFSAAYFNLMAFSVPTCSSPTKYPSTNPFTTMLTNNTLNLCYDASTVNSYPWVDVYKMVGDGIVKQLNTQYKMSIIGNYVLVDTSVKGYIEGMKDAVDSGVCHVSVADTTITDARRKLVNFQTCSYGSTSFAFLRNTLDNTTITTNSVTDLNRTDVTIAVYGGTSYETYVDTYLSAAKKIATDYDNQFILFNSKQVHAIVGDAIDLYTYRTSGSCQDNCYVRAFGDPSFFSTFTTLSITSGTVCVKMTSIVLMFILSVLSVF